MSDEYPQLRVGLVKAIISKRGKEVEEMKIIKLCREGTCCPAVKVADSKVEIGEDENTCTLTMEQWQILKEKILNKEL